MGYSRVKMYCDEIAISDAILRTVNLEMTPLKHIHMLYSRPQQHADQLCSEHYPDARVDYEQCLLRTIHKAHV